MFSPGVNHLLKSRKNSEKSVPWARVLHQSDLSNQSRCGALAVFLGSLPTARGALSPESVVLWVPEEPSTTYIQPYLVLKALVLKEGEEMWRRRTSKCFSWLCSLHSLLES